MIIILIIKSLITNNLILVSLKDVLSDGKDPKLRWEYASKGDLLPIPHIGSLYLFLGKQEFSSRERFQFKQERKIFCRKKITT